MIVGLKGYKQVGKDTVADYLVENHGFIRMAFADKLKQAVANLFDISLMQVEHYKDNQGNTLDLVEVHINVATPTTRTVIGGGAITEYVYTWREFLQRFGTEMGRNTFGKDFWIHQLLSSDAMLEALHAERDIVIADCRFTNEARAVRYTHGSIVEIVRPGYDPDGHASEEPFPDELIDLRIHNNGDLDNLYASVNIALETLRAHV